MVIVLVIVIITVLVLVVVHEFYSNYIYGISDTSFNLNKINLEIKGNHEHYASKTFLKQFLVTSYLVVGQLKYRSFILVSISHSKFSLQSRLLKVINNQTFKAK